MTATGSTAPAAAHGGLPEIVRDGQTGVLVPPGDSGALAAALTALAADPGRNARLGSAAAYDVRAGFSADALLEAVQDVYDEVLESRVERLGRRAAEALAALLRS
jgi:glycosyltransferase involved in cell wall biosynthesis